MATKVLEAVLKLDGTKFTKDLDSAKRQALAFSASTVGIGTALLAATKITANFYDEQIKLARASGTTVESFSALSVAADMSGISVEELQKGLVKLSSPSKQAITAMNKLGIATKDSFGNFKDSDVLLKDVADKMAKFKNPTDQARIAVEIFGDKGAKFVNLLNQGSAGIEDLTKQAELMGLVISTDAAESAEKFNDDISVMTGSLKGATNAVSESVIEFINQSDVINDVTSVIQEATKWYKNLDEGTKETIVTTATLVIGVGALIPIIFGVTAAVKALFVLFTTNPIALAITASVIAMTSLAYVTVKYWDQIKTIFTPLLQSFNSLKEAINGFIDPIKEAVQGTDNLKVTMAGFGGEIEKPIESMAMLGNVSRIVLAAISSGLIIIINILTIFANVLDIVIDAFISYGKNLYNTITNNQKDMQATIKDFRDKSIQNFKDIGNAAINLGTGVYDAFDKANDPIKTATEEVKKQKKAVEDAKKGVLDFTVTAETSFEKLKKEFEANNQAYVDSLKNIKIGFQEFVEKPSAKAFGVAATAGANSAVKMTQAFEQATAGFMAMAENMTEILKRNADKTSLTNDVLYGYQQQINANILNEAKNNETALLDNLKESEDNKLETLRSAEEQRLNLIKQYQAERLLEQDKEYQLAKEKKEAEFQAFLESERANFEIEKELQNQKALDKNQRNIVSALEEESYLNYVKMLQETHNSEMSDFAKNYQETQKAQTEEFNQQNAIEAESSNQTLAQAQIDSTTRLENERKASDDRITKLNKDKEAEEKRSKKVIAFVNWQAQLAILESTKQMQMANTLISGISGASQAFSALAPIPFVGIPLGLAASAVVLGATYQSVRLIQSQTVLPPAELFLAEGGYAQGKSHAQGGINATIEGGEAVVNKVKTAQLYNFIDNLEPSNTTNNNSKSVTVVFQDGSIRTNGNLDQKFMDQLGYAIAEQIKRDGSLRL